MLIFVSYKRVINNDYLVVSDSIQYHTTHVGNWHVRQDLQKVPRDLSRVTSFSYLGKP